MRLRTETISPERAAEWLARSEDMNQRSIRKVKVERLVHAIESGQWVLTHQAIALDPDGRVLDGRHRLSAIVRAGVAVEALVAWDADPLTFGAIDTGTQRTQADTLKIAGYRNTNVVAATVRSVLAYDVVKGTTNSFESVASRLTTDDTLAWLERRGDSTVNAVALGSRISNAVGRYGLTSALSAVPLIYWTHETDVGPDALAEFFERLADGANLAPYSPILSLRRFFIGETGYARLQPRVRRAVTLAVTIKAINAYALGEERTNAHFRYQAEPMPLPLSPGTREADAVARERALADEEAADAVADAVNGHAPASPPSSRRRRSRATA